MSDERDPELDKTGPPAEPEDTPIAAPAEDTENAQANADPADLRETVGAYLLDALSDEDRREFEAFLETSPETQDEVAQLAPVVALLPKLFESEDVPVLAEAASPSGLRAKIVNAAKSARPATEEGVATSSAPTRIDPIAAVADIDAAPSKTIRTAPEPKGPFGTERPQGRIRSGVAKAPGTAAAPTPFRSITRLPAPWLAAASIAILAVGAIIWALALQGRIDSKNREIEAQSAELAELRRNANATSFSLLSADAAAPEANGTLLYSLQDQIGILYVRNLPALAKDQVYQLWYLAGTNAPVPGGTFQVDDKGNGIVLVDSQTPTYDVIALTAEPAGGSEAPTGSILMTGQLSGAAG